MSNTHKAKILAAILLLAANPALAESRNFDLAPYTQIDASTGLDVIVTRGDTQSIRVDARNDSDFERLNISVTNGKLRLNTDYSLLDFVFDGGLLAAAFRDKPRFTIHATTPNLDRIDASAGAVVSVEHHSGTELRAAASSGANINLRNVTYETLTLSASSGAVLNAQGTCILMDGNVSSGADINAKKLECKTADVNTSSGGDIDLFATHSLSANASSGGDISVYGNPTTVEVNASSWGDIHIKD